MKDKIKRINKKLVFKYVFVLIFISILSGCSNNKEVQNVSLMLDYTPNTNHTGFYVAKEKGYYEEEGINLDIITPGESAVESAVATQSVDFGVSYEENLLMGNDNEMNLVSLYAILAHNTSGLMSYKDRNIISPSDLEGKTYCGWGTEIEKAIIENIAKEAGVDPDTLNYTLASSSFIDSQKSDCDFYWEFESWSGVEAKLNNIDYNYIPLKDYGMDEYTPILITSQDMIKDNYDLVQNFVNGTIKGYEYSYNNPEEASEIFLKYNPEYDEELIENSQKYITKYYIDEQVNKFGYHQDDIWNSFSTFLLDNKLINSTSKEEYTNEFIDNHYE